MKQLLFERIDAELAPARAEYERLIASPAEVETLLLAGAEKARAVSQPVHCRDPRARRDPAARALRWRG